MPNEPLRPRRPGWRGSGPPAASAKPKHAWQRGAAAESKAARAGWSTRTKLGFVGLGFVALVGVIAWLVIYIRAPKPPRLEILDAPNATNLTAPLGVYGQRAGQAFQAYLGEQEDKQLKVEESTASAQRPDSWEKWLENCKPTITEKAVRRVVLFLTMAGGVAGDEPYFIPEGADPGNDKQRLTLTLLLEKLAQLDNVPKLVVVDPVQSASCWPIGAVHNDFVRKLRDRESAIKNVPDLVVICACDADQRSWVSDEWGTSAFAHYLLEGLKGAAGGGGRDITVAALFEYVREHVHQWTRDNRDAVQTPIRLGDAKAVLDMELVIRNPKYVETPPEFNREALVACDALRSEWEFVHDQLEDKGRATWVHSPLAWREYLDRLLRSEELARAGIVPDSNPLRTLRQRITNVREEMPQSLAITLAGARAFLPGITNEPIVQRDFNTQWDRFDDQKANPADFAKSFKGKPEEDAALRLYVLSLLLERATADPARYLERASRLALAVEDKGSVRPAEIHFMVAIQEHRRKSQDEGVAWTPDWKVVQLALQVRQLAEQAALGSGSQDRWPAYSDQLNPWIEKAVVEADKDRRRGEDLMFATGKSKDALDALTKAQTAYKTIADTGVHVRHALWARDRALTQLPYFGQWVARQRGRKAYDRVGNIEGLWTQIHELDELLKKREPDGLEKKASQLEDKLEALQIEFSDEYKTFLGVVGGSREGRWHDIQAALAVPFILPSDRLALLKKSLEISADLAANFRFKPKEAIDDEAAGVGPVALRAEGQRQALLAMATMGLRTQVHRNSDGFLHEAGVLTGRHWVNSRDDVKQFDDDGRKAPNLVDARAKLHDAAHRARHLDGAAIATLGDRDPLRDFRRVQLFELLRWMAQRSASDYWYDGERPYFALAGVEYLKDAESQLKQAWVSTDQQSDPDPMRLAEMRANLDKPSRFLAEWQDADNKFRDGTNQLDLTDETIYRRTYRITAPESLAEGIPVYATRGTGALAAAPADGARTWTDVVLGGPRRQDSIPCELHPVRPDADSVSVSQPTRQAEHVLRGFFRGQAFSVNTKVTLHLLPDLVAAHAPEPAGAVRIQTAKQRFENVELMIVLDASGSMCQPISWGGTPFVAGQERRFDKALEALRSALKTLPPGVKVGLRVFSHKGSGEKDVPIWTPKTWDVDDLKRVDERVDDLRNLVPAHRTPLVDSMINAKKDFTAGFSGTQVLLVLTDGGDNFYKPDAMEGKLRQAFKDSNIHLNVVGFESSGMPETERANAERLPKVVTELSGDYQDAKDTGELKKVLLDFVQTRYVIQDGKGAEKGRGTITRFIESENPDWISLREPGYFWIRPQFGSGRFSKGVKFQIDPGDYLAVNLSAKDREFIFQRDIWTKQDRFRTKPHAESANWVGAIVQNGLTDKGRLQLMAALERTDNKAIIGGSDDTLQQFSPRIVFFGVQPAKTTDKRFRSLRFETLNRYAAPAWNLVVRDWPNTDNPPAVGVDVWWSEPKDRFAWELLRFGVNLDLDGTNQKLRNLKGSMGEPVIVERVQIEDEERGMGALVVRLRYPKDKHFVVRLVGWGDEDLYAGNPSEHRFYTEAGKYTGRFPGWTTDRLRSAVAKQALALELVSVEDFKAEAKGRNYYLHFDLGPPSVGEERPPRETPADAP
jgi:hypothetical protein